jgi:signal transduction histidine kinase
VTAGDRPLKLSVPGHDASHPHARRLLEIASRVSPRRLMRSAGVRFALIYAGLYGLSALALAVFLWWSTAGLLERQTDAAINADAQGLAERYAEGGTAEVLQTIEQRLAANIDDDAIYLLVDPQFRKIAGNLERWPARVTLDQDWFELPIERAGVRSLARVRQFELRGGFHLLVGRDVEVPAQLARLLTDALLWSAGVVLVLGTAGAIAVRKLFRFTMADVSATAAAISAGDLSRRVRVSGYGDEFDALAETINDMLGRIARLMDGVRQVSNAIAHDLRTPITRARMRLEDAAAHAVTEADLRAAIERAQADLDGIAAVFQAILRIAEIEAGASRSAFADADLTPPLLDLAEFYGAAAEEKGMRLELDIPPRLLVFGDKDMIQQAIANLLDNALKFSPPGGIVRLSASPQPGGGARIVVADQGPGIPEADRSRAAERFFRGEAARNTPGSGLGLALVQAVATLHGGPFTLEDNTPGLRATLTLPARPTLDAPRSLPSPATARAKPDGEIAGHLPGRAA